MIYLEKWNWFKKSLDANKLKEGDYICCTDDRGVIKGKIVSLHSDSNTGMLVSKIQTEDNKFKIRVLFSPSGTNIVKKLRYMTPKEIEDFDVYQQANRYNL